MRFFAVLSVLGAVSALTTPNTLSHLKRQPVVAGTGCALVDVSLPRTVTGLCNSPALANTACTLGVRTTLNTVLTTLSGVTNPLVSLCLCTEAGVLSDDSAVDLDLGLNANVPVLGTVNTLLATVLPALDLTALLGPIAALEVVSETEGCDYPVNSTPICATDACAFECNTEFFECNGACVADGTDCATAPAGRRRRRQVSNNLLCEAGRSACALPGNKFGFECLDTKVDVESCGGCAFPLPGAKKGQDCTSIPHIANVACVSGECVVESCLRGFVLANGECVAKRSIGGIVNEASEAAGGVASLFGKLHVFQAQQ